MPCHRLVEDWRRLLAVPEALQLHFNETPVLPNRLEGSNGWQSVHQIVGITLCTYRG